MVTECPILARSAAAVSPAGPEPTTATFFPVGSPGAGICTPFLLSRSATNRSRYPIETDAPFLLRIHACSHCVSWGHTRPQTAGSALSDFISFIALAKSPSETYFKKAGIFTSTGQPFMHFGALH